MANPEHVERLKRGARHWNRWREDRLDVLPDLSSADLNGINLSGAKLFKADFRGAILCQAHLIGVDFRSANLSEADLSESDIRKADFSRADLTATYLSHACMSDVCFHHASLDLADFSMADLNGADLAGARMYLTNFQYAELNEADLNTARLLRCNFQGAQISWAKIARTEFQVVDLSGVDLTGSILTKSTFYQANLSEARAHNADLSGARFSECNLSGTDLTAVNLSSASLNYVDLRDANLIGANLTFTKLSGVVFVGADLRQTNLAGAELSGAAFGDNDLSSTGGLDSTRHKGPSTIGIDTLYYSAGKIPERFLLECGVPETFITFIPSLIDGAQPILFHSVFISHSKKDEEFAQFLHTRMRAEKLRVWYAPADAKSGQKLYEQISRAIQVHDKLLLILSENSMKSEWVISEIRRARKVERAENRRKLFPIRLVDFTVIQSWECFDADSGKDLAVELREYYIPDFSNWKTSDAFEAEFAKLLRHLKSTES